MDHYRCYLDGELAKLADPVWAGKLADNGACIQVHALFRRPSTAIAESFVTQDQVNAFVRDLDDGELVDLTTCLSVWRNNNVRHELSPAQRVSWVEARLDRILLAYAEGSLHDVWRELDHQLLAIASDARVLADREYARHEPGEAVNLPCLAKPAPGRRDCFWVVDGVHRAIQAARNGDRVLRLCVYEPA